MKLRFLSALLLTIAMATVAGFAQEKPEPKNEPQPAAAQSAPQGENAAAQAGNKAKPEQAVTHASNEAAGHGEGEDEEAAFKFNPVVQWTARKTGLSVEGAYWLFVVINFLVILWAIVKLMRSGLPGAFRKRTEEIRKGIDEARRTSEEAHARLTAIEGRLGHLDNEIREMQAKAESEAAEEESRLKAAAEEEKRKIVESAEREIEQASVQARRELQRFAAQLAIDQAERQVRVSSDEDKALVQEFAAKLPDSGGKS